MCKNCVTKQFFFLVTLTFCFNIHFIDYKAVTQNTSSTDEVVYPAKGGLTHDLYIAPYG